MKKALTHFLLCFLVTLSAGAQVRQPKTVDRDKKQYRSYMAMPSQWLLKRGDQFLLDKREPDSALMCFTVVADRFRTDMDKEDMRECLEGFYGRWQTFFFGYGNAPLSMGDLGTATEIVSMLGEPSAKLDYYYGVCYLSMGINVGETPMYDRSMYYLRRAVREAYDDNDILTFFRAYDNLATAAFLCDSLSSIAYETNLVRTAKVPDEWRRQQSLEILKGFQHQEKGDLEGSLRSFNKLIRNLPRSTENMRYLASFHIKKMRVEKQLGHLDEMKASIDTVLFISYKYDFPDIRQVALSAHHKYYTIIGDSAMAERTNYHFLQLKDSLMSDRFMTSFQEVAFNSERREMQRDFNKLSYHSRLKGWILSLSGVLLLLAIVFLIVLRRNNHKLRERSEMLYRQVQKTIESGDDLIAPSLPVNPAYEDTTDDEPDEEEDRTPSNGISDEALRELAARIRNEIKTSEAVYEPDFSLGKLAQAVGSNRKYVSQAINGPLKTNFPTLINQARIREAIRRIDNKRLYADYSIEGIAESVGFRSRSSFSVWFKRFTGLSAAEYRRIGKEGKTD